MWIGIPDGFWVTVAAVTGVGLPTEISVICVGLLMCPLQRAADGGREWRTTELRGEGVGLRLTDPRRGS
ncbi:hypothetical protein GCM10010219_05620 [Streptomyces netropsis]|nr:hypothetical protein GCM10010219_05620 [Streptomyces netropsis]